ncbi:MAG TPA: SRPBCC family protein [Vicinamibacterales bacterium]|nr:SRPBCC family protein [Vicinamibacterales bacterium]
MHLQDTLWVPRPRDEVFAFFANAANLEALTPPWLRFRILNPAVVIETGARIDYRLTLHGIPLRWQSEISRWDPPASFVDEQRKGPYRRWVHTHTFASEGGGTRVGDSVEFAMPFEWLVGRFVMRDVQKIFAFRRQALMQRFGSVCRQTPRL